MMMMNLLVRLLLAIDLNWLITQVQFTCR